MKILTVDARRLLIAFGSVVIVACGENAEPAGPATSGGAGAGGSVGATGGVGGAGSGALGGAAGTGKGGTGGTPSGGAGSAGSSAGVGGTGGVGTGGATGGVGGSAGSPAGNAGAPAGSGGAGNAGAAGSAAGAGASAGGAAGSASGGLAITPSEELWTGVRYYTGSVPSNRTSGPSQGPSAVFQVHNGSESTASVTVALAGTDAEFFEIVEPASFPADVAAGADLEVTLRLVTDNAALGAAPAQDDGATVLEASLTATAGTASAPSVRLYALVLTYVELEPTFGQILDAFPAWRSNIPASIRNDANPNPGTLPGVEAGTDEVAAPAFTKAVTGMPVTMLPIGRFSPPGQVPFGYHTPGNAGQRTTAGTLAEADDAHTNDKSRMLLPPLASGMTTFDPGSAPFAIFMEPAGVGTLSSEDAEGFDGAHRVKIWTLRDSGNNVIPNSYLVGGEEAANGDYQDYVFVLSNVTPG